MKLYTQKVLTLFFIFIVFILLIYYGNTYMHENAHRAIANNHYCTESEIHYFEYPNPYFRCTNRSQEYNNTVKLQEEILHSTNEIVGYNITSIILTLFICTFIIVTAICFFCGKTKSVSFTKEEWRDFEKKSKNEEY